VSDGGRTSAHDQIVVGIEDLVVSIRRPNIRIVSDFDGLRKPLRIGEDSDRVEQEGFER
jgi:hypothetical protein